MDWSARYRDGDTPWEKGEHHPALPLFLDSHQALFKNRPRIFHPGCGFGRDAAFLAPLATSVTALDISEEALNTARNLHSHTNIRWAQADLFNWPEKDSYQLVWEHTCLCAIPPTTRPDYAQIIHQVLEPHGLLCGIFFLNPNRHPNEGPPFPISREELHALFDFGFDLIEDHPNPTTYLGRENRETLMIWQKKSSRH